MTWQLWTVVGFMIFGIIMTVAFIGEPREPLSPRVGAGVVAVNLLLIALILTGAT